MSADQISRRGFLGTGATAGAGLLWTSAMGGCALPAGGRVVTPHSAESGKAKNIIFLVADGMNTGTWTLADYWLQNQQNKRTEWVNLYAEQLVHRSLMETCSANSLVTDSAAAGSSWSCGQRINNGAINFDPDGNSLVTIHDRIKKSGRSTGLVTTTRMTHATPATFASSVSNRGMEDEIALQYLNNGVDVLLGGGTRHFSAQTRKDGEDLFGKYKASGYQVLQTRNELLAPTRQSSDKILGTFWQTHLPYSIDWNQQPKIAQRVPKLSEMMRVALKSLDRNPNGFLLQVEGGRVDHAGHGNDPGAIVHDQLAFDECIKVALEFSQENPETLVVVTTDHGCGGCQLNGVGASYVDTDSTFYEGIGAIRASYEYLKNQHKTLPREEFRDLVEELIQLSLTEAQIDTLDEHKDGLYEVSNYLRKWHDPFKRTGVNFTSSNHTGEFVELSSWGPGSGSFNAWIKNTDVNQVIRKVLELS